MPDILINSYRLAISVGRTYLRQMRKTAFLPCIPTRGTKVPAHPDWLHEIKHDGYRLIVQRDGKRVRLWTRNGYDWSGRFPLITEAALRIKADRFVVDGEAVLLGVDGVSDFAGLHSRKFDHEAQFYAFDLLVSGGDDLRSQPLFLRKGALARLLKRRVDGIMLNDFERGEIGPELFKAACQMGLEGLVSKRRDRPYRAGRSPHWIKVKNPIARDEPSKGYILELRIGFEIPRYRLHRRSRHRATTMEMVALCSRRCEHGHAVPSRRPSSSRASHRSGPNAEKIETCPPRKLSIKHDRGRLFAYEVVAS